MRYSLKLTSFVQYFVVLGKSIFLHFRSISIKLKKVVSIRTNREEIFKLWLPIFINTCVSYRIPTVHLISSKNKHIIEFYAVHDLNYSLGISLIPSMSLFDFIFAQYLTELLVQMLLGSRTLPGEYTP
ncbi:hypothetical protein T12_3020 [Trichinella patagoniensis]|uniref:Uncharacterized protein n=1 Tax=Trichinella patagoniensis TaxID=990121 RepID=A0A0V0ZVG1_9BILA|nr:hypothetical protein T12_3020 [Trichinella patagoniensis]